VIRLTAQCSFASKTVSLFIPEGAGRCLASFDLEFRLRVAVSRAWQLAWPPCPGAVSRLQGWYPVEDRAGGLAGIDGAGGVLEAGVPARMMIGPQEATQVVAWPGTSRITNRVLQG
jgi:hypothetical protein